MHRHGNGPVMEQAIFNMGLSTEAVSLYLLCCHLVDSEAPLSPENLSEFWNGTPQTLAASIDELEHRNVIETSAAPSGSQDNYRIKAIHQWH